MNVKWHWLSFIVTLVISVFAVAMGLPNGKFSFLLAFIVPILIFISIRREVNNLASTIGFYIVLVSIVVIVIGVLDANAYIPSVTGEMEFRGLAEFIIAFVIQIIGFISYLIGLFIPKK